MPWLSHPSLILKDDIVSLCLSRSKEKQLGLLQNLFVSDVAVSASCKFVSLNFFAIQGICGMKSMKDSEGHLQAIQVLAALFNDFFLLQRHFNNLRINGKLSKRHYHLFISSTSLFKLKSFLQRRKS